MKLLSYICLKQPKGQFHSGSSTCIEFAQALENQVFRDSELLERPSLETVRSAASEKSKAKLGDANRSGFHRTRLANLSAGSSATVCLPPLAVYLGGTVRVPRYAGSLWLPLRSPAVAIVPHVSSVLGSLCACQPTRRTVTLASYARTDAQSNRANVLFVAATGQRLTLWAAVPQLQSHITMTTTSTAPVESYVTSYNLITTN